MQGSSPDLVRRMRAEDLEAVRGAVSRAFEHDPLMVWLADKPFTPEQISRSMFDLEYGAALRSGLIYTNDLCQGIAIWYPPGEKLNFREQIRQAWGFSRVIRPGKKSIAQVRLMLEMEKYHPKIPHFYLRLLGVDPAYHGQGIGSRLVQPVLTSCDQQHIPAYLETFHERNVPYYNHLGFKVIRKIVVQDWDLTGWLMWREPGS